MVNKLPDNLDNPIDIFLYKIIDTHLEFYYKNNFTPNKITTLSLISGLLSGYAFYKDQYIISGLLFLLSYYFDCTDGKFARKYNMVSKFGDIYDHISDVTKVGVLILVMYYKSKKNLDKKFKKIIIPVTILYILLTLFLECQEKIYNKKESEIILQFNVFTLDQCKNNIKYLRYFSPVTIIIYITFVILLWRYI
jgi:phosphatidylglycerophosphate synthase